MTNAIIQSIVVGPYFIQFIPSLERWLLDLARGAAGYDLWLFRFFAYLVWG